MARLGQRGGGARVVGDHEYGLLEAGRRFSQELEHLGAGLRIEVPRRLVGQDDVGEFDQGSRYGDSLLLATGELVWPVRPPRRELHEVQELVEPLP